MHKSPSVFGDKEGLKADIGLIARSPRIPRNRPPEALGGACSPSHSKMVGKKSSKAIAREDGIQRTDNNMDLSSWPVVTPINQKNFYVDYIKRDEQFMALRLLQEEQKQKKIKDHLDRDRALAMGRPNLRVGLASDALPRTVPMVIARRAAMSESEEGDGEPAPKRVKLDNGLVPHEPEKRFGEDFAKRFAGMSNELKVRMRANKIKVLPQSRDMVTSHNRRTTFDTIHEHNDTMRIEWTEPAVDGKPRDYITGREALRIPEQSNPRYRLYWPIRHGWLNEADYPSARFLREDVQIIIGEAIKSQLGLGPKDWQHYSCVIAIPDYYERTWVTTLLDMAISDFGFARVSFIQESLAASFGAGVMTACMVDIGAQKTAISCLEDGMIIEESRVNLKYGGDDVTEAFVKMILYNHFPYADINLKRRYDFLLAEELKTRWSTMIEPDIVVQTGEFHLRAPNRDTRKYSFKIYDEVALPSMGFFKPDLFNNAGKLNGRRKLIDISHDIYDGRPNDPTSKAQLAILTEIAPPELVNPAPRALLAVANGINGVNGVNGSRVDGTPTPVPDAPSSRRPSVHHLNGLVDGNTPQPSAASSPMRRATPNGTPGPEEGTTPLALHMAPAGRPATPEEETPLSLEHRSDILPVYPLSDAIMASINHAAKGSAAKTRDFFNGIYLIGGASQVPGLDKYLEAALQGKEPGYAKDIIVNKPPRELDPQVVIWKGGAVFGRMSRTNDSWVDWRLYERLGERVLSVKLIGSAPVDQLGMASINQQGPHYERPQGYGPSYQYDEPIDPQIPRHYPDAFEPHAAPAPLPPPLPQGHPGTQARSRSATRTSEPKQRLRKACDSCSVRKVKSICDLDTLEVLIDDYFIYIHPLIPVPHEPSFRAAFARREDKTDRIFLGMIAAMVEALVASFPRRARRLFTSEQAKHQYPNAGALIDHCHAIFVEARGIGYLDREPSVNEATSSYLAGISASYVFDVRRTRMYWA
ncbi:hypothetical protein DV737_g4782, partial [Chaetothyriales sp. CBS 132003]